MPNHKINNNHTDGLTRPSIYKGRISAYMNKAHEVFDGLHEHSHLVKKCIAKRNINLEDINQFWQKYQYTHALLQIAYAEERLSEAYAENEMSADKLANFKENIIQTYKKLEAHKNLHVNGAQFVQQIKWLAKNPECVKPKGEYICYDEVKRLSHELMLELILPAIILCDIEDAKEYDSPISASISHLGEPAIIATLKALSTRKKFTTGRSDFIIYLSLTQNGIGKSIVNNDDYLNFLINYCKHYNRLDCIQHLKFCNKGEPFVKSGKQTLKVGKHLSATIICGSVKQLTIKKRTFIINDKGLCKELK
ncbi:MAG: hypothetical protein ACI9TY_001276 [Alphaproteobacteria bacterium]|jgi:hypothetical protein